MKYLSFSPFPGRETDLGHERPRPDMPCFSKESGAGGTEGTATNAGGSSRALWKPSCLGALRGSLASTVLGHSLTCHVIVEKESDSGS